MEDKKKKERDINDVIAVVGILAMIIGAIAIAATADVSVEVRPEPIRPRRGLFEEITEIISRPSYRYERVTRSTDIFGNETVTIRRY